jgi:hypothetical protein
MLKATPGGSGWQLPIRIGEVGSSCTYQREERKMETLKRVCFDQRHFYIEKIKNRL